MTDFRTLCAELAYELDAETGYTRTDGVRVTHPTVTEARAALAQPEPEEQVLARVEFAEREFNCPSDVVLRQYCDDWFYGDPERSEVDPVDLCRGAIKLFAQIPAPIPLSERLPGEGDCDGEGCCWVASDLSPAWHRVSRHFDAWDYWLPHYALPVPQQEAE